MNEDRKAQERNEAEENEEQPREDRVEDLDVPEDQGKDVKGGLNYSKIEFDR